MRVIGHLTGNAQQLRGVWETGDRGYFQNREGAHFFFKYVIFRCFSVFSSGLKCTALCSGVPVMNKNISGQAWPVPWKTPSPSKGSPLRELLPV